jgi:DNA ligase (NAD+)
MQFRARLAWLGGKQGLRMNGVGEDTWQGLIDAGLIRDLLDWMVLTPEQIAAAPGFGEARAHALARAFSRARQRPFVQWMHALGMPASGEAALPDWATVSTRQAPDWRGTVGPGRAVQLVDFFGAPAVRAQAERLHQAHVPGF